MEKRIRSERKRSGAKGDEKKGSGVKGGNENEKRRGKKIKSERR